MSPVNTTGSADSRNTAVYVQHESHVLILSLHHTKNVYGRVLKKHACTRPHQASPKAASRVSVGRQGVTMCRRQPYDTSPTAAMTSAASLSLKISLLPWSELLAFLNIIYCQSNTCNRLVASTTVWITDHENNVSIFTRYWETCWRRRPRWRSSRGRWVASMSCNFAPAWTRGADRFATLRQPLGWD